MLVPPSFLLIMLSLFSRRTTSFVVRSVVRNTRATSTFGEDGVRRRIQSSSFHSTPPWLADDSVVPANPTVIDSSAVSKSRAPFRAPRNSQDDSVPQLEGGVLAWTQLGLFMELVDAVHHEQHLDAPTPVQQLVIPELLKQDNRHLAFLAATGSGKTLAYALPILQTIKSEELFGDRANARHTAPFAMRKPKRPRALILAPTRELAVQITAVVKQLCHKIKLSSQSIIGSEDYGKQRKALDRRLDVLVATPGRLLKHWNAGNVHLGDVQHIVLDEMDTMLEQGFQQDLIQILHPLLYKRKGHVPDPSKTVEGAPRIVLTSATMTQAVARLIGNPDDAVAAKRHYVKPLTKEQLEAQEDGGAAMLAASQSKIALPTMKIIKAPGLHRAVPRLQQVFVDVGNIDKLSLLVDVVHSGGGRGAAVKQSNTDSRALTIVFCNTVHSCRAVSHALAEAGLPSHPYHGELNSLARTDSLTRFRAAGSGDADEANILVCTDLAARGLDVPEVDHVVMFDFPLNALDYLHRSGRTARGVGGERKGNGRVTALVAKRDKVLATAIEKAVQRGDPLDGLSSRKSDYAPGAVSLQTKAQRTRRTIPAKRNGGSRGSLAARREKERTAGRAKRRR